MCGKALLCGIKSDFKGTKAYIGALCNIIFTTFGAVIRKMFYVKGGSEVSALKEAKKNDSIIEEQKRKYVFLISTR